MNIKTTTNRKWITAFLIMLVAFVVYVVLYPPVSNGKEAVAKVNGVSIAKEQLYDAVLASSGQQTLQTLIENELIRQEAEKAGIQIQTADIDKELESTKSMFSSEEEFNQALATYGMTLDSLKENVETQLMLEKLLEPQTTVTDDEIKQYYDENLDSLKTPEQVKASHILVSTKEEAEAILKDLQNGADFAKTAQEKSLDTASKDQGGNLDYFAKGEMEEAFETAAFSLEVGQLSDVVQTSKGYHIIKVTDHKQAATPTLEEKKEEIRKTLMRGEISTLASTWLEEKKSEASIENYL